MSKPWKAPCSPLTSRRAGPDARDGAAPPAPGWLARAPEPALICGFDRRIVWANAAFARLAGRSPEALDGVDYATLVPVEERPAVEAWFLRLAAGDILHDLRGQVEGEDGERSRVAWMMIPEPESGRCIALGRHLGADRQPGDGHEVEAHLADGLEHTVEGFALFDDQDRLLHGNRKFRDMYGSLQAGRTGAVTFAELTRELAYSGLMAAARGREEAWIEERIAAHRNPAGMWHTRLSDGRWIQVDEQRTSRGGTVLVRSDITEVKQREQAYALFATAVDQSADAIEIADHQKRLLYVNPAFTRLTGYQPAEVLGRLPGEFLRSGQHGPDFYRRMEAAIGRGEVWSGRLISRRKDGALIHQDATISPLHDDSGTITHFVTVKRDVTGQIEAEARIRHLAHHDALTDLPNRALFRDRLRQALAETRRSGEQRALLMLDLDHFKEINDTLGHDVGDALLCQVARRLEGCVREADTVGRLGGDEFAILQARAEGPAGAAALARRVIHGLAGPFEVNGREIHASTSIGITMIPDDGHDLEQVLKQADLALYRAKSEGRGTFQFFLAGFRSALEARATLERDLRAALEAGQLALEFQPLIDLESMTIHGMEALLRWRHPRHGLIPPVTFIPIAEECGMIMPLTRWVLESACGEARLWRDQQLPPLKIAVNLSPAQFRQRDLVEMVEAALAGAGLPGHLLELEIQEAALTPDPERSLRILERLGALGVHISMDDFGTGASSLSALRRFPLNKIKIDRSFVREVCSNPETAAVVRAIIELAKSLRLRITAEGVETGNQLRRLRDGGCEEAQGFLLSQPMAAGEVAAYVRQAFARDPAFAERMAAEPTGGAVG